jgi:ATP-dependent DNA ligase
MIESQSGRFIPPCIPTRAVKAPAGPDWVHETKHDGYRLQVRRDGDTVRLFTRNGYDWSARYPAISVTATLLRAKSIGAITRPHRAIKGGGRQQQAAR